MEVRITLVCDQCGGVAVDEDKCPYCGAEYETCG